MSRHGQRAGWATLPRAWVVALQWRVMLIFIVLMALPTAVAVVPVAHTLGALLDHSVASSAIARHFQGLFMGDVMFAIVRHGAGLAGAQGLALIVTLGLSPFLTGVIVSAVHTREQARLGELMHGGLGQYWRMLRLMLWSIVPYGIAIVVGAIASHRAMAVAGSALTQSAAERGTLIAVVIFIVLMVLAHVIMESSRAQIAADGHLRSATRAFRHGMAMLARHPLATLGLYLGSSIPGYVLAGLVGIWRIHTLAVGGAYWGALAQAQLIVIILVWQRLARIDALAHLAAAVRGPGRTSGRSILVNV